MTQRSDLFTNPYWPDNQHFNGLQLVWEREDENTIEEKRENRPHASIIGSTFILRNVEEEFLPRRIAFWFYDTLLETGNLRCDSTCSKAKDACWCSVAPSLVFKRMVLKTLRIRSRSKSLVYNLEVEIERSVLTHDEVDLYLTIKPAPNYMLNPTQPSTTYGTTTITFLTEFQENRESLQVSVPQSLYSAKIEVDCYNLPFEIKTEFYTSVYLTPDNLNCYSTDLKRIRNCPIDSICWCPLINQLRSSGEGNIRLPIRTKISRYYSYWMNIRARRDEKDHNLIHLEVDFTSNHHTVDSIPKNLSNYIL